MVRVSLTVGKDRGPYDNKTPAALCPFNTNDKLPRFTEASSFWKETLCWQTKQMQGRDTKSVYCCASNHWVELFLKEKNNECGKCSDQKVWNVCLEAYSFILLKLFICCLIFIPFSIWKFRGNDDHKHTRLLLTQVMLIESCFLMFNTGIFFINRGRRRGRKCSTSASSWDSSWERGPEKGGGGRYCRNDNWDSLLKLRQFS